MIQRPALLRRRSIRFQLTSLMDLLLIIVFAQYLEFHRSGSAARAQTQEEIARARQEVQRQLALETSKLNEVRDQLLRDNQKLRTERNQAAIVADESQRRQQLTSELVKKLLQVDADLIDRDLSPPESLETLDRAQATAQSIGQADGTELLRFLAGYDELLKRAEIWTLHVSDRGDIEIEAGSDNHSQSFRLETATQAARSEEFTQQMRAAYLQLPQPKGLVVILVSYSPRAVAGNYQPVLDGMPTLIEWLDKYSGDRTRFEYSVIGAISDSKRDLTTKQIQD